MCGQVVPLLVEEVAILEVLVWIVTCERIGHYLLVCVAEVYITHVLLVVEHVGVVRVVVPEVVLVVLSLQTTLDHKTKETSHTEEHVRPEEAPAHIEP